MIILARVCVDATFFQIDPSGNLTFRRESVGLQQRLTFPNPGTFNFTKASFPGLTRLRVRVVGGGGAGAGANADTGESVSRAGGGGGGYSESVLDAADLGASETITVGAGGTNVAGNTDGDNGNQSSFGGFVMARGGAGAIAVMPSGVNPDARAGSPGGSQGIGHIITAGGSGGPCIRISPTVVLGGAGGDAGGGMGQGGIARAGNTDGADGRGYGGGGGGATSTGGNFSGGDGSPGVVIIELYY